VLVLVLIVLGGLTTCGPGTTRTTDVTEVQVKLSEFKFDASQTSFKPGQTYRLVVTNIGQTEHELMITPPATAGLSLEQLHTDALAVAHGVAPGATQTVEVTFPADAGSTPLEFACHIEGHYEAGMKLPISIEG